MADDLKRVGIVFKADGTTDFAKSLTQINALTKENYNSFKLAQSQYDKNTSSVAKLTDTQKYLSQNIELYRNKVAVLNEQLKELEIAENRNESAIAKKKAQLDKAKTTLNNYEKGLEEVNAKLESGSAQLQDYADRIGQASENMKDVGTSITKHVTAPILALGTASMVAWNEIDEAYDNIILKTGATGDSLESLKESFDNVYGNFPFDSEEVANAIGEVNTRFKLTGQELENLSTYLLEYSSITGTDVAESTAYAQKIQQQWGLTLEDTKNVLGLIAYQGQATGISIESLMESVTKNSYAFKEMGLSVDESINLMAQFEANGLEADAMLTGLKKASQNYAKEGKSMNDGLGDLINRLQKSTTYQDAFNEAVDLFGSKNALAFATAAKEGKINLDSLNADLSNYSNVVNDNFNSTQDPIDRAKVAMNNLKLAGTELGESIQGALAPTLEKLAKIAENLADWFKNLNPSIKEIIVIVGGLLSTIGPLLVIFGTVGKSISNLLGIFAKLKLNLFLGQGAISSFGSVLAAITSPVGIAIAAITSLIAIFSFAYTKNDEFREKVNSTFNSIKEIISKIVDSIKILIQSFVDFAQSIWNSFGDEIIQIVNVTFNTVSNTILSILNIIKGIIDTITALIKGDWEGVWNGINDIVCAILESIKNTISNSLEYLNSVIKLGLSIIHALFENIFNGIKSLVFSIWDGILTKISDVINGIKNIVSKVLNNIKETVSNIFNGLKSTVSSIWNGIKNAITTPINDALNFVKNTIDKIKSVMNFNWSLPKLKLPHISIVGEFSLNPLSVPHFDIKWYRKAMNRPMLLNNATIFGMANGNLLGGGEASGTEIVAGEAKLMSMIERAMGTSENASILKSIYNLLLNISKNSDKPIVLDSGALVGYLIGNIDNELGYITQMKLRGVK